MITQEIEDAGYVGLDVVNETVCHHIAWREPGMDVQLWIDQGEVPLMRKLVVTFDAPGHPRYRAQWMEWNLDPVFDADHFTVIVPDSYREVPLATLLSAQVPPAE